MPGDDSCQNKLQQYEYEYEREQMKWNHAKAQVAPPIITYVFIRVCMCILSILHIYLLAKISKT